MLPSALRTTITQDDFAKLVGISQPRVAQLLAEGLLPREGTADQWLLAYCERLREQAAGRDKELTLERAALARSQRRGQDIKNAVAEREYAPAALLGDVLAIASAAIADQLDSFAGDIRKVMPDLPPPVRDALLKRVAAARNNWIKETADLIARKVDDLTTEEVEESDSEEGDRT